MKHKHHIIIFTISAVISGAIFFSLHLASAQTASKVTLSAFILENKNRALLNGDYAVRFALYTQEDGGTPVWQESQTITIKNGSLRASLGQSTPLNALDVQNTTYHLGITLNDDSEMSPRVAIGSAFSALNAQTLQGHTVGTEEGNLAILDPNAKFNKKLIPKLTKLGTVTVGTWEGEKITSSFLTSTFPYLAIGDGTPSSIDESNDLYVTDDLEVDGTIFGTFSGTVATGFTQGSVVFTDATGSLAQDNANFFWDDTNNRLGVGTSSPSSTLTVQGDGLISGNLTIAGNLLPSTNDTYALGSTTARWSDLYIGPSTIHIGTSATDEGTISYNTTNNILNLGTDSTSNADIAFFTDDLYLDKSTGYVGIGTTSPAARFHILDGTEQLRLGYDASNYWTDAIQYDGERTLTAFGSFANFTIDFSNATDGYQFIIDPNDYDFVVDTYANKVGIGQSPSATLDISSTVNASTHQAIDISMNNAAPSPVITGVRVNVINNTSAGLTDAIYGVYSGITNYDNAGTTLTEAASFVSEVVNYLSGGGETLSNAYGLKISDWINSGTITTSYGIYMDSSVDVGVTSYALYSSSASNSYFAGNVGIGDASPAALLTVGSGDLFQVNSSGAIASVVGITSSSNYVQSAGTFSLTSANTTQTTTSSAMALNVNSLTTGTGLYAASSTLTSGKLVDLQISGTAAAASQTALDILTAGANATSGITTYGAQISNTHTNATSGTNVALYLNASGATTANYGLIVNAGNVGVGTTSPSGRLHVADTSGNLPFYVTSNIGDGTGVLAKFDRTTTSEVFTIKAAGGITLQSSTNLLLLSGSGQGAGIDATYGFLGVKDTTPDALFEASLNGLSTFDAFQISSDAANDGDIFKITNYISDGGRVGIGTTSPAGKLHVAGNVSASAWGTAGIQYQGASATFTDSSTAASGTATNAVFTSLAQPTLAASNTGVTTTYASTLYVANAPIAGTNQTISNAYSLWVDDGTARFDGKVGIGTSAPSFDLEVVNGSANATFMLDSNTASDSVFRFREGGSSRFVVGNEGSSDSFRIGSGTSLDTAANIALTIDSALNVGIGTTSPSAFLHVLGTTEQLRLGYDASYYLKTTVSSQGLVTFQNVPSALSGGVSMFTFKPTSGPGVGSYNIASFADETGTQKAAIDNSGVVYGTTLTSTGGTLSSSANSMFTITSGFGSSGGTAFLFNANAGAHGTGFSFQDNSTSIMTLRGFDGSGGDDGFVGIGTTSPAGKLHVAGNVSASAWGTAGIQYQGAAATFTDSSTAASGTATNAVFTSLAQPTLAASNTGVTTTYASTLYVANAPTAGTNQTISNAYSLWVDDGTARFDGRILATDGSSSLPSIGTSYGSGGTGINFSGNSIFFVGAGNSRFEIDVANGVIYSKSSSGYKLRINASDSSSIPTMNLIGWGGTEPVLHVLAYAATQPGIVVQAAASQSANLQEWQNSAGTALTVIDENGYLGIGTTSPAGKLHVAGNVSASAWGTAGIQYQGAAATFTDSSTAASGTATSAVFTSLAQPTLAASNTSVTTTYASTLYVANAPTAGTNQTISNAYSLWVDDGTARFDGTGLFSSTLLAAANTSGFAMRDNGGTLELISGAQGGNAGFKIRTGVVSSSGIGTVNATALDIGGFGHIGAGTSAVGGTVLSIDSDTLHPSYTSPSYFLNVNSGSLVVNGSGYVGIGTTSPSSLMDIYSSTAHPVFTVTGAHATDYDPQIQFSTDATPTVKFSLGVDAADDSFKIYSGSGIGGTSEFSIDTAGVVSIANLELGAQAFETNAGIVSWMDMPVTSAAASGTVESYSAQIDGTSFLTIYAQSDGSGGLTTTASAVKSDVQLDATTDGLATKVNAGACSDTTFTRDTNGTICIDSTNGRIYYRYGAAWHYSAQTAGFQIPTYETYAYDFSQNAFDESSPLAIGDFLIPFVESRLDDNAVHGLYARFSDVKDTLFAKEKLQITDLSLKTDQNITTLADLQTSVDDQLILIGTALNEQINVNTQHEEQLTSIESRLASNETNLAEHTTILTQLQAQMDMIREENKAITDFFLALNPDTLLYKDSLGNIDLGTGTLTATGLETGTLTITLTDASAPTIGSAVILPVVTDTDSDGIDDDTGADGMSIVINTTAISATAKIFTNFSDNPGSYSWTDKKSDSDGDYTGFIINLSAPITTPVKVDWWIVQTK